MNVGGEHSSHTQRPTHSPSNGRLFLGRSICSVGEKEQEKSRSCTDSFQKVGGAEECAALAFSCRVQLRVTSASVVTTVRILPYTQIAYSVCRSHTHVALRVGGAPADYYTQTSPAPMEDGKVLEALTKAYIHLYLHLVTPLLAVSTSAVREEGDGQVQFESASASLHLLLPTRRLPSLQTGS